VIWQIDMGRIRARLFGHTGWIQAITFRDDDDGTTLASADDDTVRIWNIISGNCIHQLPVSILFCFIFKCAFTYITCLDCQ
jgi:WD40 repeat protein